MTPYDLSVRIRKGLDFRRVEFAETADHEIIIRVEADDVDAAKSLGEKLVPAMFKLRVEAFPAAGPREVSELAGALLDAAVARAQGRALTFEIRGAPAQCFVDGQVFAPSTNREVGGAIVERERIAVEPIELGGSILDGHMHPGWWIASCAESRMRGPTPLIAAMRCFVSRKLGETVDI